MSKIYFDRSKCDMCLECIGACPFNSLTISETSFTISDDCRMCLLCVKACPKGALSVSVQSDFIVSKSKSVTTNINSYKGIMVFCQCSSDKMVPVTFELVGKAKQLARKVNQEVLSVLIGKNVKHHAQQLLLYGIDKVLVYDHPLLENFMADIYTDVLEHAVKQEQPSILLVGATPVGRSLAPRLAVRLRTGLTADCTSLDITSKGELIQTRPAFGGNVMAEILTPRHRPQMATVRHQVMEPAQKVANPTGIVHCIDIDAEGLVAQIIAKLKVQKLVSRYAIPQAESIQDARIIIAAGRGVRTAKDISMLEKLAKELGGVIGCTRPLVEKGWFSVDRQIGLSGRTVRPDLYIACGISGAVQHTAGMMDSSTIIAINRDENAPIFDVAHYAVVGDLYQVIPAMAEALSRGCEKQCYQISIGVSERMT